MHLLVILLASILGTLSTAEEIGKPHSTVINLKDKDFDAHLNDPANGLWLLKFYAPWCGHCKQMAPVLDAVAPFLAGKMSIGKIDCTVEKSVCKRFNVKGYPTLKYYRDGDFQEYPLGRDKDSIITFGEKMSDRAVKIVSTYEEANTGLLSNTPVAFLVFDPNSASDSSSMIDASGASESEKVAEKLIQSTERTRVFGQVARKMQAHGTFGLLSPFTPEEEVGKFFDGDMGKIPSDGFIARIEEDVPTKIYTGQELTTVAVEEFAKVNNIASAVQLGGHNFRFVSRRGKALAIAVVNPEDEVKTNKFQSELKQYAVKGQFKDEYIFGTMDGIKWDKFLSQFSITKENLPELFILDTPNRKYWQDASVSGIAEFISAIQNGEIEAREQEKVKKGAVDEAAQLFVDYMPYSLIAMFALFGTVFYLAFSFDSVGPLPPLPPALEALNAPKKEKEQSDEKDESKKDK